MSKSVVLDYVDRVMSKIEVSDDLKVHLENELIRHFIEASEDTSIDEVKNSLAPPEELAEEIADKLLSKRLKELDKSELTGYEMGSVQNTRRYRHPRYVGEYMREQSHVNLKLLYIPLVQISSGTERISMPLTDEYDD